MSSITIRKRTASDDARMSRSLASTLARRSAGLGLALLWVLVLSPGAAAALEAGDRAPAFSAPGLTSKQAVSLSSYKGKVVYVDFWASWCAPCAKALPVLNKLQAEFGDQGFQVVAVNLDRDPAQGRSFLERYRLRYPSASDPEGSLPQQFGLETMPTSYLIDRSGIVRYVHRGFRKGDDGPIREEITKLVGGK